MTSKFSSVIIRDERIQSITTQLPIMMKKGPSQTSHESQPANSSSITNATFHVDSPGDDTCLLDRRVLTKNTVKVKLNIPATNAVPATESVLKYGEDFALSAFPVNNLITMAGLTINACNLNVETQDVFGMLSKMYDQKDLNNYYCPTMIDSKFKHYSDMELAQSNPLGEFTQAKGDTFIRFY